MIRRAAKVVQDTVLALAGVDLISALQERLANAEAALEVASSELGMASLAAELGEADGPQRKEQALKAHADAMASVTGLTAAISAANRRAAEAKEAERQAAVAAAWKQTAALVLQRDQIAKDIDDASAVLGDSFRRLVDINTQIATVLPVDQDNWSMLLDPHLIEKCIRTAVGRHIYVGMDWPGSERPPTCAEMIEKANGCVLQKRGAAE